MKLHWMLGQGCARGALALVMAGGMSMPAWAGPATAVLPGAALGTTMPAAGERIHVAQNAQEAQLSVRIQQLEEQVRNLTGQIEGLQFQLTQMQTLIENQTQDNEFRFQQLEGGGAGKTDAVTQSGGATPSGELPQDPVSGETMAPVAPTVIPEQGVVPLPGEQEFDPTFDGTNGAPMDDVGESRDPLLGTGRGEVGVPLGSEIENGQAQPLNLDPNEAAGSSADAQAQYRAGYDAIMAGDYATAEDQFRQFISLYPNDPAMPDATNLLGDALIQRGAYDEAADVLLTGYQKYPDSTRAPDLLLRLGMALAGAGEQETACRTFGEVTRRYTNLTAAFQQRLASERQAAGCAAG